MKPKSTILSLAALATLSLALFAEGPAQKAAGPQPAPDRRVEADTAIKRDVMQVIQVKPTPADIRASLSRVARPVRSLSGYTMAYVEAAPDGIAATPAQIPFEVQQPGVPDAKGKPTVFLTGYYDANSKSVQLYDTSAKKYLAAAEHPFIKARAAAPLAPK
jgi:hypothetical protein